MTMLSSPPFLLGILWARGCFLGMPLEQANSHNAKRNFSREHSAISQGAPAAHMLMLSSKALSSCPYPNLAIVCLQNHRAEQALTPLAKEEEGGIIHDLSPALLRACGLKATQLHTHSLPQQRSTSTTSP